MNYTRVLAVRCRTGYLRTATGNKGAKTSEDEDEDDWGRPSQYEWG